MDTQRLIKRLYGDWKNEKDTRFTVGLLSGKTFSGRIVDFDPSAAFFTIEAVHLGHTTTALINAGAVESISTVKIT